MQQMTSEMKQQQIDWRREVLELSSQGYTEWEIAEKLQPIAPVTVHRDLIYLRQQAQENLQKHIHEVVPEEYQKCMIGMKQNLKHILEIGEAASDPKIKLQARATANDCYRYIMELCTNAGIVSDALKFVNQSKEKINNMRSEITKEETAEESEATTNGVY